MTISVRRKLKTQYDCQLEQQHEKGCRGEWGMNILISVCAEEEGTRRRRITLLCLRLFSSHEISTGQIEITGNNNVAKGPANVCFPTNDGLEQRPPFSSSLPSTAWKTCEATQTNRQKNRNQLANCTRRCPSPLTLTLTQALVETPLSRVSSAQLLLWLPLSLCPCRNCCVPRLVLWTEGCDTQRVWVWTCRRQDHNNRGDCKRNPWLLF